MNKNWRRIFAVVSVVLPAVGFVGYTSFVAQADDYRPPLQELRIFSDVYTHVKTEYVEEVDDKALLEGAIRGMMAVLDP